MAKLLGPIIVVDDSSLMLEVILGFLKHCGFKNVLSFNDPIQALTKVKEGLKPSFVITDYDMPGINGLEMLKSICLISPGTPGLIITGNEGLLKRGDLSYPVILKGTMDFPVNLKCFIEKALSDA